MTIHRWCISRYYSQVQKGWISHYVLRSYIKIWYMFENFYGASLVNFKTLNNRLRWCSANVDVSDSKSMTVRMLDFIHILIKLFYRSYLIFITYRSKSIHLTQRTSYVLNISSGNKKPRIFSVALYSAQCHIQWIKLFQFIYSHRCITVDYRLYSTKFTQWKFFRW